jgi:hypothetical protein
MLARPSRDPVAVAAEIERLRSASDLYFQAGLAGLIALHGRAVVEQALRVHPVALGRTMSYRSLPDSLRQVPGDPNSSRLQSAALELLLVASAPPRGMLRKRQQSEIQWRRKRTSTGWCGRLRDEERSQGAQYARVNPGGRVRAARERARSPISRRSILMKYRRSGRDRRPRTDRLGHPDLAPSLRSP